MRKSLVIIFVLTLTLLSFAGKNIHKSKDGIYTQQFQKEGIKYIFQYVVDPRTQLCFVCGSPMTDSKTLVPIPCDALFKIDEWKPILKWVKEKD